MTNYDMGMIRILYYMGKGISRITIWSALVLMFVFVIVLKKYTYLYKIYNIGR